MIKLKVKEEYWVLTDLSHSRIIDESNFNDLRLLRLTKKGKYFTFENEQQQYMIKEDDINQLVFKDQDDYLKHLTIHLENLNLGRNPDERLLYEFDDFIKEKIIQSQKNYPEKWI
jgi:hypothetical protein